jgi:hypothetical protein
LEPSAAESEAASSGDVVELEVLVDDMRVSREQTSLQERRRSEGTVDESQESIKTRSHSWSLV